MIRNFTMKHTDLAIFRRELDARLPDLIVDNHIHVWTRDCLQVPRSEYAVHKRYKPWTDFDLIEEFTIDECEACFASLLPGKRAFGAYFGLPFPQIDRIKSNAYVMERAAALGRGFYYMPGQFEDMADANRRFGLAENRCFLGLKPYPDLVAGNLDAVGLYDMLNQTALEFANRFSLAIVLHIPRKQRLHDAQNRRELDEIARNYPCIRLIIAHVGRAFCFADVEGTIDFLTSHQNVLFDTAFVDDPSVFEYLMRKVPAEKILYGSDAPLAFTRGKDVCVNNKHYYVSESAVPWGISPMEGCPMDLTFYVYEQIRAMLQASRRVYGRSEDKQLEKIFGQNALTVFGEKRELYA